MKYMMTMLLCILNIAIADKASTYQWKSTCNNNQTSMNLCARDQFKFYDERLNQVYKTQISYLSVHQTKSDLKSAQRAWITFRDKDCLYNSGKQASGGSIWPLTHFNCLTKRTKTRIKELEEYVRCREIGCPI